MCSIGFGFMFNNYLRIKHKPETVNYFFTLKQLAL
jgi:hypothetical protein